MSQNVYGIDIGTSNLKIFNGQTKTIINEKNIIAIRNKKDVFAIGNEAFEMYEKGIAVKIFSIFPSSSYVR